MLIMNEDKFNSSFDDIGEVNLKVKARRSISKRLASMHSGFALGFGQNARSQPELDINFDDNVQADRRQLAHV